MSQPCDGRFEAGQIADSTGSGTDCLRWHHQVLAPCMLTCALTWFNQDRFPIQELQIDDV